jgi:hypothetical protein
MEARSSRNRELKLPRPRSPQGVGWKRLLGSADRRAAGQQSNTDQQMALRTR